MRERTRPTLRSLVRTVLLLLFVGFVIHILLRVIPGEARDALFGTEIQSMQDKETSGNFFLQLLGSYIRWVYRALSLDFGTSPLTGESIRMMIGERWKLSVYLALLSFIPAMCAAVVFVFVFDHSSRLIRRILRICLLILMSFTPLTLGLCIIILITIGNIPLPLYLGKGVLRYVVPVTVLTLSQIPFYATSLLSSVMIAKKRPSVAFAHTLGYSRLWIWTREILPNALLFTVDISAIQLGYIMGGTLLLETLFALPGLGSLFFHSVISRDREVVQGIVILTACIVAGARELALLLRSILTKQ